MHSIVAPRVLLLALLAFEYSNISDAAGWEDIPYNRSQFKAAHNSIDREESLTEQLNWDEENEHQGGCRGLELDIVADPERLGADDEWEFAVQHGGEYDAASPRLQDCLDEIKEWSKNHADHGVLTIHIDLKEGACTGDPRVFANKIDSIFAGALGREAIFTPRELQRDAPSLLEGARLYGWPKLGELKNRLILCFSGGDGDPRVAETRQTYAATDPLKRLAFVDLDMRVAGRYGVSEGYIENPYYNEGSRVFLNLQRGKPGWLLLAWRAQEVGGFVTRVWKCNTSESWHDARSAGVNVISTDRIRDEAWAVIGSEPFREIER